MGVVVNYECGEVVRAASDDELVGTMSRDDVLAMGGSGVSAVSTRRVSR